MSKFFACIFCLFLLISGCGSPVEESSLSPTTSREGTDLYSASTTTSTTEDSVSLSTTSTTSTTEDSVSLSTTSTTTTEILDPEVALLVATYEWMESSDRVAELQRLLGLGDDGVYGSGTRAAHENANEERGLEIDMIPVPPTTINPVNALMVAPGGAHTVRGSGFSPGSTATATLYSDPVVLGSGIVGDDGRVSLTVEIPSDTSIGDHELELSGQDFRGEEISVITPITIGVDETPPVFGSVSLSATSVDISSGPQTFTVSVAASDDATGIGRIYLYWWSDPAEYGLAVCTSSCGSSVTASLSLASGTVNDGVWEGEVTVPVGLAPQTWAFREMFIEDAVSNEIRLYDVAPDITITSANVDETPPVFGSVSLSATSVDISSGPQTFTVSVAASDDATGIGRIYLYWWSDPAEYGLAVCTSSCGSSVTASLSLASGTVNDGVWEGEVTVPVGLAPQTWAFREMFIEDAVSNEIRLYDVAPDITIINTG